jgi:hypothetical protein
MKAMLLNDLRRIVTLFAGFIIGMHSAVLLHEFGHALGYWLSGGTVTRIVMEAPLPAGHVGGHGPKELAHFWVWGGVVFGSIVTVAPLAIARRRRVPPLLRFAALMTAAFCLGHNGMYLFIGSVIPFSDASDMINLGAPRWLLFVLGIPLIVGFIFVLSSAIQLVDLKPTESLSRWIIIVELGLLSFPAVMVASMFFMPVPSSVRSPTIAFVSCYAVSFSIATYRAREARRNSEIKHAQIPQRWSATCALALTAVALVIIEWLAFGTA